jgi:hypothetical protein
MHSVLMQWADAGSLDDFIATRLGHARTVRGAASNPGSNDAEPDPDSRSARIRAFRAAQAGEKPAGASRGAAWTAVHLLSPEEVEGLSRDVVEGLNFLVGVE